MVITLKVCFPNRVSLQLSIDKPEWLNRKMIHCCQDRYNAELSITLKRAQKVAIAFVKLSTYTKAIIGNFPCNILAHSKNSSWHTCYFLHWLLICSSVMLKSFHSFANNDVWRSNWFAYRRQKQKGSFQPFYI